MVDYLKAFFPDADVAHVRKIKLLDFKDWFDPKTSEVFEEIAMYRHLRFIIRGGRHLEIRGSIHAYWHGNNYCEFNHMDLASAISHLCRFLCLNPEDGKIQRIEYGVNITPPCKSTLLLNSVFRFQSYNLTIKRFGGNGYMLIREAQQYYVKVYDKARHYKLPNQLLRFEVGILKMLYVEQLGINTLADLLELEKLKPLNSWLLKHIHQLVMGNPFLDVSKLTKLDKTSYNDLSQRSRWETFSAKYHTNRKNRLKSIIEQNSQRILQDEFKQLVSTKWQKLCRYSSENIRQLQTLISHLEEQQLIAHLTRATAISYSPINTSNTELNKLYHLQEHVTQYNRLQSDGCYHSRCCVCGQEMQHKRNDRKTCGKRCRNKLSNAKHNFEKRVFNQLHNPNLFYPPPPIKPNWRKTGLILKNLGY